MDILAAIQNALDNIEQLQHPHHPVFVPSRHRADTATTPDLLHASGVPHRIVVEPHDADAYVERYGADRVMVLDDDERGIAYARNFIMDYARAAGTPYVWMIDDDMRRFRIRRKGKRIEIPASVALAFMELVSDSFSNVAGASVMNSAFAFGYDRKPPVGLNQMIYCVQLVKTDVHARFRAHLMDDTDYSLQVLTEGYCTLISRRVVHEQPSTSKQPGGCTDTTHTNRLGRAEAMVKQWPGCFYIRYSKDGLPRLGPSQVWRKFPQRPQLVDDPPLARWA
jgi:hypothetical protein